MGLLDWSIRCHKSIQAKDVIPSLGSILFSTICIPLLLGGIAILIAAWAMYPFSFLHNVMLATLGNAIVVLLLTLYLYVKYQIESQQRLSYMEKEKMKYQFEALKNQVNPHFLFNSLNVLASLAYQDADKTNLFTKNLQLRSYVESKNGIGLTNLRNQYFLHGEDLKIQKNEKDFVVEMTFIQKDFPGKSEHEQVL